jgi:CheY-like chemotaxis protein
MAKLLLIEKDPVSAAVIEDRLRVAGHQVEILADAAQAADTVDESQIDLVVLDVPRPRALEPVRALRERPATRSVAIIVISESNEPSHRVAALRAGADDYLGRPFDPEELEIRVERLLGSRIANLQLLQGDLVSHPLWAVLQYLRQVVKTGHLRVRGGAGSGTIDLREGDLVAARWQGLRGGEALLTLLSVEDGNFRFDAAEPEEIQAQEAEDLPMTELLMRSAWLKDELEKRRQFLPATGEPLVAMTETLPAGQELGHLPLQRILSRIARQPGARLFDLMADEAEAPLTTRLALAWLFERGYVASRDHAPGVSPPATQNTMEISNAIVFDVAVADLVANAAAAGLPAEALPYLVLVEPPAWPELRRLIEAAPGFPYNEGLRRLVEQVELRRAGSATFTTPGTNPSGKLSLHVQVLTGATAQPQLAAIVPGCAGVLVWLANAEALDTTRNVIQRLDGSGLAATGLVVAGSPAAQVAAAHLVQGSRKWRISPHTPQSLLGILRLLYPRETR